MDEYGRIYKLCLNGYDASNNSHFNPDYLGPLPALLSQAALGVMNPWT